MMDSMLPLSIAAGAVKFDESQPGWALLEPTDEASSIRACTGRVDFERGFVAPPVVQIGITGFDIDNGDNARLQVGLLLRCGFADPATEVVRHDVWRNVSLHPIHDEER